MVRFFFHRQGAKYAKFFSFKALSDGWVLVVFCFSGPTVESQSTQSFEDH